MTDPKATDTCGRCNKPKPCDCGRPTKLTVEFIAAMMEVVNDQDNAVIYMDEDLIFMINDKLPMEARIDPDTFRRWKGGDIKDDVRAQKFYGVYKRASLRQKSNLFKKLDHPENSRWQKEAWKVERKFDDWNIKQKIAVATAPEDGAQALAAVLLGGVTPEKGVSGKSE